MNICPKFFFHCLSGVSQSYAHIYSLSNESEELQNGNTSQDTCETGNPPIGRRFIAMLASGIGGYISCLWGLWLSDRGRRFLGYTITALSSLVYVFAVLLMFLTGFRWSWGWWF
jgi:hypothetical protein